MGKAGLTPEILNKVSSLVNAAIQQEMSVHTVEVPLDVAIDSGALGGKLLGAGGGGYFLFLVI